MKREISCILKFHSPNPKKKQEKRSDKNMTARSRLRECRKESDNQR